jgi:hypothetical protein
MRVARAHARTHTHLPTHIRDCTCAISYGRCSPKDKMSLACKRKRYTTKVLLLDLHVEHES